MSNTLIVQPKNVLVLQDCLNALDLARNYQHSETVEVLEQYMALLSAPTEETITPKYTYTRKLALI